MKLLKNVKVLHRGITQVRRGHDEFGGTHEFDTAVNAVSTRDLHDVGYVQIDIASD